MCLSGTGIYLSDLRDRRMSLELTQIVSKKTPLVFKTEHAVSLISQYDAG